MDQDTSAVNWSDISTKMSSGVWSYYSSCVSFVPLVSLQSPLPHKKHYFTCPGQVLNPNDRDFNFPIVVKKAWLSFQIQSGNIIVEKILVWEMLTKAQQTTLLQIFHKVSLNSKVIIISINFKSTSQAWMGENEYLPVHLLSLPDRSILLPCFLWIL